MYNLRYRFNELFRSRIKTLGYDNKVSEKEEDIVIDFYSHAFMGIVCDWIEDNMEEDFNFIIETLKTILQGELIDAIERLSKSKL